MYKRQDKETIYTCYVMDAKRALEGVVTVKDLLMHPYEEVIGNIMDSHVIKAEMCIRDSL